MPDSTQAVTEPPPAQPAGRPQQDDVDQLYSELVAHLRATRPHEDLAPLEKAYAFASARHQGQKRVSGEPFMVHPLLVTRQLADMHMDMCAWKPVCCTTWWKTPPPPSPRSRKNLATTWRVWSM